MSNQREKSDHREIELDVEAQKPETAFDSRLSASAGFQKSWHNGDADRDLFVGKFHYLPLAGWDVHGTAWVDFYTSGDTKSGLGLTQAYLTAHRTFASRNSVTLPG